MHYTSTPREWPFRRIVRAMLIPESIPKHCGALANTTVCACRLPPDPSRCNAIEKGECCAITDSGMRMNIRRLIRSSKGKAQKENTVKWKQKKDSPKNVTIGVPPSTIKRWSIAREKKPTEIRHCQAKNTKRLYVIRATKKAQARNKNGEKKEHDFLKNVKTNG